MAGKSALGAGLGIASRLTREDATRVRGVSSGGRKRRRDQIRLPRVCNGLIERPDKANDKKHPASENKPLARCHLVHPYPQQHVRPEQQRGEQQHQHQAGKVVFLVFRHAVFFRCARRRCSAVSRRRTSAETPSGWRFAQSRSEAWQVDVDVHVAVGHGTGFAGRRAPCGKGTTYWIIESAEVPAPATPRAPPRVGPHARVVRHEREAFELRLRHEHAVERVAVMSRQGASGERVRQGDREHVEARRGGELRWARFVWHA